LLNDSQIEGKFLLASIYKQCDKFSGINISKYVLFLLGILPTVSVIWWQEFFLTQDGPSHLYNAFLLSLPDEYFNQLKLSEYFTRNTFWSGNSAGYLFFVSIVNLFGLNNAEQILITIYALFSTLALVVVLPCRLSGRTILFLAGLIPLIVLNPALHFGFFNFCLGIPFGILATVFYVRTLWFGHFSVIFICFLVAVGSIAALLHPVVGAFVVGFSSCYLLFATFFLPKRDYSKLKKAFICLLPPKFIVFSYYVNSPASSKSDLIWEPFAARVADLLHGSLIGGSHTPSARIVAIILIAVATLNIIAQLSGKNTSSESFPNSFQGRAWQVVAVQKNLFLNVVPTFLVLSWYLCAPDHYAGGGFIGLRLGIALIITLFIVVGTGKPPPIVLSLIVIIACAVNLTSIIIYQARLNIERREYSRLIEKIPPNSTLLPLHFNFSPTGLGLWSTYEPTRHIAAYQAIKSNLVLLNNYEADFFYFPVQFLPTRSPYGKVIPSSTYIIPPSNIDLDSKDFFNSGGRIEYIVSWDYYSFLELAGGNKDYLYLHSKIYEGRRVIAEGRGAWKHTIGHLFRYHAP
jgi:hypothetical protein